MFIAKKRDKSGNASMNARLTPHFCQIHGRMARSEAPHERASEEMRVAPVARTIQRVHRAAPHAFRKTRDH